jgi:hypothetical protein
MKPLRNVLLPILFLAPLRVAMAAALPPAAFYAQEQHGGETHSADFDRAAQKFAWISANAKQAEPSTRPTVLTAGEWNAYLNEGGVKLPTGLTAVRISSEPSLAHGDAEVDFDRLTANRTRNNPLLALFTGRHHVSVTASLSASHGSGTVRVQSVFFDGVEIPRFALDYFASRFLRPQYGSAIGMNATFPLGHRIDAATVGNNQVTLTQR